MTRPGAWQRKVPYLFCINLKLMSVRKFSGKCTRVVYSAKSKSFILACGQESIIVGEQLMSSMAMSQGLTKGQLLRSIVGSAVSATITHVKAGDPVLDRTGKPLIENGSPRVYRVDHDRYSDVSIEVVAARLQSIDVAEAIGSSLAASFAIPSAPVTAPVAEAAVAEASGSKTEADKLLTELEGVLVAENSAPVDPVEAPLAEVAEEGSF